MRKMPQIIPSELMQRDVAWLKRRRAQLMKFRGSDDKRERLLGEFESRLERSRQMLALRNERAPRDESIRPRLPDGVWGPWNQSGNLNTGSSITNCQKCRVANSIRVILR